MDETRRNPDPTPLEAPSALRRDLRALVGDPGVPAAIEERLRAAARERLAPAARARRPRLVTAALVAAAAAAAAVLALAWMQRDPGHSGQGSLALGQSDVDGSGRVDILDAYLLARRVREGEAGSNAGDVDGNGVLDERDVAAITAQAVRIDT